MTRRQVLTLLDFCFKHEGITYNFPTLIFYQMGYEMSVIWQASRRAYRLNQKEECRNYYFAYRNTLQEAALSIMARKQIATAALQGKFSTEGLATMAQGVDAKAELAASLSKMDERTDSVEGMFDVLAQDEDNGENYNDFVPNASYYEIIGESKVEEEILFPMDDFISVGKEIMETPAKDISAVSAEVTSALSFLDSLLTNYAEVTPSNQFVSNVDHSAVQIKPKKQKMLLGQMSLF